MPPTARDHELDIHGRTVKLSNVDKVFYPATGFTKGHLIHYYIGISKYLLPHLRNRPVTLKRYPNGIEGISFYEKDAPKYTPEWVRTFPVPRRAGGKPIRYILVNDLATLVWCANIATLEFHPFLHRKPKIESPSEVVFDLDPGPGMNVLRCAEVAFLLREALDAMKLQSFAKVSGSKGLQIYVPLNTPAAYDRTQPFARALAQILERRHPKLVVSDMAKQLRNDRIFIDWSQNSDFKTTAGVYSMRAKRPAPFVSMPVSWDELKTAMDHRDPRMLDFEADAALTRVEEMGDLFAPVLKLKQRLPKALLPPAENRGTH